MPCPENLHAQCGYTNNKLSSINEHNSLITCACVHLSVEKLHDIKSDVPKSKVIKKGTVKYMVCFRIVGTLELQYKEMTSSSNVSVK